MKSLIWFGSSKKELMEMPQEVWGFIGHALHLAQTGSKHSQAKPLQGFGSAGVLEVVEEFDGNAYRAVYTVRFEEAVYVLHCFQKKSTQGARTSKQDIELVRQRLSILVRTLKGATK
jgi:phage-related protein